MSAEFYAMVEGSVAKVDDPVEVCEDGSNDATIEEDPQEQSEMDDRKRKSLYQKWVACFPNDGIVLEDDHLICTICCKNIVADKKSRLSEHIGSKKHRKILAMPEDERPNGLVPIKRQKVAHNSSAKAYAKPEPAFVGRNGRDKSHEVLLADTLNLFVQLDVSFDKLNSEVWQNYVKKHVKNGEMIMKNFTFYQTSS